MLFYNELDVLKIRLEELSPVVDRFVIVESNLTFRGNQKPYIFDENKHLFSKYLDKIRHIKLVDDNVYTPDPTKAPWEREKWQRNQIALGLEGLAEDDIIIISDVDEIPRRSIVAALDPDTSIRLGMNLYYYSLNVYEGIWGGAKAVRKHSFTSAEEIRLSDPVDSLFGGWHFSYLGTPESILNKLQSFSHWELDTPDVANIVSIKKRMEATEDIWGQGATYTIVPIDDTWPEAVKNDLEYYKKYIR